jgi:hypothetical protein
MGGPLTIACERCGAVAGGWDERSGWMSRLGFSDDPRHPDASPEIEALRGNLGELDAKMEAIRAVDPAYADELAKALEYPRLAFVETLCPVCVKEG